MYCRPVKDRKTSVLRREPKAEALRREICRLDASEAA
jgi:hypothetical protein